MSKKDTLNRRDFLKIIGATLTAGVLGNEVVEYVDGITKESSEQVNWQKYNFLDNPNFLTENPHVYEKIILSLNEWGNFADELWKVDQKNRKVEEVGGIELPEWDENARELVNKVKELGKTLSKIDSDELNEGRKELELKYSEYATYLHYTLVASNILMELGPKKAHKQTAFIAEQNIPQLYVGSDDMDKIMPSELQRLKIHRIWNYPWKTLSEGGSSGTTPILSQIVSGDGGEFISRPATLVQGILSEKENNIEKDPKTLWQRPPKVDIINFEPEVAKIMEGKFKKLGLERGLPSISWMNIDSFEQGQTDPNTQEIRVGGGVETLDIEAYNLYSGAYDQTSFHETLHVLIRRSEMLRGIDRVKFRDIMLKIAKRHDPFRSIKTLFSPDDEYPDISEEDGDLEIKQKFAQTPNEMIATEYSINLSLGAVYNESVKKNLDELRSGLFLIGGKDIYADLYPKDRSISEYIDTLESTLSSMNDVSKLIAKTIIDNKQLIQDIKRRSLLQYIVHPQFIPEVILPLITTHLAIYQTEELQKAVIGETGKDIGQSFFYSWQKQLEAQISKRVYEEMVADIVGYMLVDKRNKKEIWGDTLTDLASMLKILKQNGLASIKQPDAV